MQPFSEVEETPEEKLARLKAQRSGVAQGFPDMRQFVTNAVENSGDQVYETGRAALGMALPGPVDFGLRKIEGEPLSKWDALDFVPVGGALAKLAKMKAVSPLLIAMIQSGDWDGIIKKWGARTAEKIREKYGLLFEAKAGEKPFSVDFSFKDADGSPITDRGSFHGVEGKPGEIEILALDEIRKIPETPHKGIGKRFIEATDDLADENGLKSYIPSAEYDGPKIWTKPDYGFTEAGERAIEWARANEAMLKKNFPEIDISKLTTDVRDWPEDLVVYMGQQQRTLDLRRPSGPQNLLFPKPAEPAKVKRRRPAPVPEHPSE